MYEYTVVNVAKVIDGDTYDLDLDLGLYIHTRIRVRLAGIDTYEIFGKNAHPLGLDARWAAFVWLTDGISYKELTIRTFKLNPEMPVADGSFGRWAADVYRKNVSLADYLREQGYEKPAG